VNVPDNEICNRYAIDRPCPPGKAPSLSVSLLARIDTTPKLRHPQKISLRVQENLYAPKSCGWHIASSFAEIVGLLKAGLIGQPIL